MSNEPTSPFSCHSILFNDSTFFSPFNGPTFLYTKHTTIPPFYFKRSTNPPLRSIQFHSTIPPFHLKNPTNPPLHSIQFYSTTSPFYKTVQRSHLSSKQLKSHLGTSIPPFISARESNDPTSLQERQMISLFSERIKWCHLPARGSIKWSHLSPRESNDPTFQQETQVIPPFAKTLK